MAEVLSRVLVLAWGLLFGGLLAVFLAVTTIFAQLNPDQTDAGRAAAGRVAAAVFGKFEPVMLAAGLVAVLAAAGLLAVQKPRAGRPSRWALLGLFVAALVLAGLSNRVISPRINAMRLAGQTHSPEFKSLHGQSMLVYVGIAGLTTVAGLVLPAAIRPTRSVPTPQPGGAATAVGPA